MLHLYAGPWAPPCNHQINERHSFIFKVFRSHQIAGCFIKTDAFSSVNAQRLLGITSINLSFLPVPARDFRQGGKNRNRNAKMWGEACKAFCLGQGSPNLGIRAGSGVCPVKGRLSLTVLLKNYSIPKLIWWQGHWAVTSMTSLHSLLGCQVITANAQSIPASIPAGEGSISCFHSKWCVGKKKLTCKRMAVMQSCSHNTFDIRSKGQIEKIFLCHLELTPSPTQPQHMGHIC